MADTRWLIIGSDERMRACAAAIRDTSAICMAHPEDEVTGPLIRSAEQADPTHVVLPVQGLRGELPEGLFRPGTRFFTGLLDSAVKEALKQEGHCVRSYLTEERFVWNNARLTAEAFVRELYTETQMPLAGMEVMIAGFGRVGRTTADVLGRLGADVTVFARSDASLGEAEALGFKANRLTAENLPLSGSLVNTIPARWLARPPGSTLRVFELASMPGCLKPGESTAYYTVHLGLPGKHFPGKAGEYLAQTVLRMCREE